MKKTLTLSIGGALFYVEEDAYEKLERYINQLRAHFHADPNGKEILEDIESRIAERFSEHASGIVTVADVADVMETMGAVEQFDGEEERKETESSVPKKLYRDPDNAIVAGVSSGLGHFFGVDPVIFRLIFVFSVFLGGTGVIIYILLWLLVPEAKTSSQKLSMKGNSATISAMAEMIKAKIEEVNTPEHKNAFKKFMDDIFRMIRRAGKFVGKRLFPLIRIVLGVIVTMIAFGLAVAATMALVFSLFHISPNIIEGPFLELAHSGMFQTLAVSLYLVVLIPLSFTISLGTYLMTKRPPLTRVGIMALLGVWFIALPVAGATGTQLGIRAAEIFNIHPYYKKEVQTQTLSPFSKLVVTDDQSVTLREGETYSIEYMARAEDMARVRQTLEGDTLTISEDVSKEEQNCLMCGGDRADIVITVPSLSSITLKDSAYANGDVTADTLTLTLDNGSYASLDIEAKSLAGSAEDSSRAYLRGTVAAMSFTLANGSRLDGWQTEVKDAELKVVNSSHASVYATDTLNVTAMNGSSVEYRGTPEIADAVDASSRLEDMDRAR